jgi:hypothetical protein
MTSLDNAPSAGFSPTLSAFKSTDRMRHSIVAFLLIFLASVASAQQMKPFTPDSDTYMTGAAGLLCTGK